MSQPGNLVTKREDSCSICGSRLREILDLPRLPLTDTYSRTQKPNPIMGIDQRLLYCERCGHGQLESLISPEILYEEQNYLFRTSASATARRGTDFFQSVLDSVSNDRQFKCVLDVGCNDMFLLQRLKTRATYGVGIDPILRGREGQWKYEGIIAIGKTLEEVRADDLPEKPDLIVCRHTLEHITDPRAFMDRLFGMSTENALFVFEVPSFDGLIGRLRFDQVFHQHVNYFSLRSFRRLLDETGGHYVLHRFNYHDWGAMAVAFTKSASPSAEHPADIPAWTREDIVHRYGIFRKEIEASKAVLSANSSGPLYGYGAAQMLPVLAYHFGSDFHELKAILDDDREKDGIGFWNLPVRVMHPDRVNDFTESTVLVTAFDNIKPIMLKLLDVRPLHIIVPLNLV